MAIHPAAGFHERDRWQSSVGNVAVKVEGVLDVRGAHRVVGHDLRLVLDAIADVAVLITIRANDAVVQLIFVGQIPVPLIVVGFPGNMVFEQHVGDAALIGGRNCEWRVVWICVRVGVAAVTKVAGVVVVQQVVVGRLAIRFDGAGKRTQVVQDGSDPGL